ncbi:MAG: RNA polymerase subunit sigma-70 [Planctomycetales bacterium]|nr:RNA polymerase subunit sigma-70 [Planctomycetales bacterium]
MRNLPLAEDSVQFALSRALVAWRQTIPEKPTAWLFRVANNYALDQLRRDSKRQVVVELPGSLENLARPPDGTAEALDETLDDSLLRMIFLCCDSIVPIESQTALALKTLCGFSIAETASALISTPESIGKRIQRAKERLRQANVDLEDLSEDKIRERLPQVQRVVYLLFNEGYSSTQADRLIREELCEEAVRLALLLAEHPLTQGPDSAALLALLLFHSARLPARIDSGGCILLFHQQNVADWDNRLLREAYRWFALATQAPVISRYHAEAMIAAEHCRGKFTGEPQWQYILAAYDLLCRIAPSPIHELNRAIALAHHRTPADGLAALSQIDSSQLAQNYYLWHAAKGELHYLAGETRIAESAYRRSFELAPTNAERELICRKLDRLPDPSRD